MGFFSGLVSKLRRKSVSDNDVDLTVKNVLNPVKESIIENVLDSIINNSLILNNNTINDDGHLDFIKKSRLKEVSIREIEEYASDNFSLITFVTQLKNRNLNIYLQCDNYISYHKSFSTDFLKDTSFLKSKFTSSQEKRAISEFNRRPFVEIMVYGQRLFDIKGLMSVTPTGINIHSMNYDDKLARVVFEKNVNYPEFFLINSTNIYSQKKTQLSDYNYSEILEKSQWVMYVNPFVKSVLLNCRSFEKYTIFPNNSTKILQEPSIIGLNVFDDFKHNNDTKVGYLPVLFSTLSFDELVNGLKNYNGNT
ncbi:MAG: hypothetical protein WC755_04175 [Candidatus Woesearchaeota archaeon]|jgi:hypothetical protein